MHALARVLIQDTQKQNDIPADYQLYMMDEMAVLGEETPIEDCYTATAELIAALIYFKPWKRVLPASHRAALLLDEIRAEVSSWTSSPGQKWPIQDHEARFLKLIHA